MKGTGPRWHASGVGHAAGGPPAPGCALLRRGRRREPRPLPLFTPTPQAMNAWLRDRGESALKAGGGVFMWGAAAHAVYLVAVPEPLRPVVARRNARRAMVGGACWASRP